MFSAGVPEEKEITLVVSHTMQAKDIAYHLQQSSNYPWKLMASQLSRVNAGSWWPPAFSSHSSAKISLLSVFHCL